MSRRTRVWTLPVLLAFGACAGAGEGQTGRTTSARAADWRSDWDVEKGFVLEVDAEGFQMPSAIAFVPDPGPDPGDPLYFVTEVRGEVKVVTNDRHVYPFASDFVHLQVEEELPSGKGQGGLAGLCLDPEHGYVFVTFAYQDDRGILRNNIIRFETEPGRFALRPRGQTAFTEIFNGQPSGLAHQIGPCVVQDGSLYVSVGEAWQTPQAQQLGSMVGKIIRMTLDGAPAPGNPYYGDGDPSRVESYVWAYGLRNPFGLKRVGDRLFAVDNGVAVDRFMEIERGRNYLWDGSDWSIAAGADYLFTPSVAPVQLDYYTGDSHLLPDEYAGTFFAAAAGNTYQGRAVPGVIAMPFDLANGRMRSVPRFFVRYRGGEQQIVAGLAFGPDGMYFAPMLPGVDGRTPILRVRWAPESAHPFTLVQHGGDGTPNSLMRAKGCLSCHSLDEGAGYGGGAGPSLERTALVRRLRERLSSLEYRESVARVDQLQEEPFASFHDERQEVLEAAGDERVRLWLKYRIMEPRFDQQVSQMPNLGLTEGEAEQIAAYLAKGTRENRDRGGIASVVRRVVPANVGRRGLVLVGLVSFFAGGALMGLTSWALRRRDRRPDRVRRFSTGERW